MTTVLVTGATGNVGSPLVAALRERGIAVRAFGRDPDRAAGILGPGIELARGDFADPASIRRALVGVDQLFLACANDPRQVAYETDAIDAAAAAGVRRIVKLSAMCAEIGSPAATWDWHGRIERHLRASGVPAVLLRPAFYMTNLLGSAEGIKHAGKLVAPAGGARIAMIDPRDVAAVAAAVLAEDGLAGDAFELTGPAAVTFDEVAAHLSTATGRRIGFVAVPDQPAREALVASGTPDWLAENIVTLFGLLRGGALARTTDAVRAVTGRAPRGVAEFARDHARLFGG